MEITEEVKERIRNAIAEAIGGGAYDCTRVWSAWGYGTMPCKICITTGNVKDGCGRDRTCPNCDGKGRVRY